MTTPRATKDGRAALPSVMDMFGELAMTSQYKISLHLGDSEEIKQTRMSLTG